MKKAKSLVSLLVAALMVMAVVLTACGHQHTFAETWSSDETYHWHAATCEHTEEVADKAAHNWGSDGKCTVCLRDKNTGGLQGDTFLELDDYKAYVLNDLDVFCDAIGEIDTTVDAAIASAKATAVSNINGAASVSAVQSAFDAAKQDIAGKVTLASGTFDFTGLSQDEKTKILGALEGFAIRTGTTGITLYENGGYVMYNPRVTLGTENYITGYGFGVLSEGNITADLDYETNTAWKRYYHTYNANDPATLNYLNDQGSEVSDFYSYIGASYYTAFMNDTKDGYEWVPELAAANPVPADAAAQEEFEATGQTAKWKFEIRDGLKYSTLSQKPDRSTFNNRDVVAEDFITPFKLLLNQDNGLFRGEELSKSTGASSIKGAKEYFAATKGKGKGILSNDEVDFSGVGVKVYQDPSNQKWYFEFELGAKVTSWYARYYISSSLYMPVPKDFIDATTVDYYLGFNADKSYTPVDNSLSLGAYTVENWTSGQQVTYKKNPNYVYASTKYNIPGVHIRIMPGTLSDNMLGFNEFLAGHIDASGIPSQVLEEYKNDQRTRRTTGDSCFKLNVNALDAETWEEMFGVNGKVAQTPRSDYWQVEPALSNSHFRNALSYALNRNEFATSKGYVSSLNFFSSNYMSDPEHGIPYFSTEAHEKAIAPLLEGTDEYGYSLELARDYFRMALDELEASGAYTRGTKAHPTVINLEIAWQAPSQEEQAHNYVKRYWEEAFNDDSVSGGCYKLNVEFWVGNLWSDVYYKKMMLGQFDIGFGSISGNSLDPLNFMEVLSSNQTISGNFTLNWGVDTNDPDADILVYQGKRWSYDALYMSSQQSTKVLSGQLVEYVGLDHGNIEIDEDHTKLTATLSYNTLDGVQVADVDFVIFAGGSTAYNEFSVKEYVVGQPVVNGTKTTYTLEIPISALVEEGFTELDCSNFGIDLYASYSYAPDGIVAKKPGLIGTYSLSFAKFLGVPEYVEDPDTGDVTVTYRIAVMDGLTSADVLDFVIFGYVSDPVNTFKYQEADLADCIVEAKDAEGGVIEVTIKITKDLFEDFLGGVISQIDFSEQQGVNLYLVLSDEISFYVSSTSKAFTVEE